MVDEPGVHGLLPSRVDPHVRLLVTDDRGYDVLSALLPRARSAMITVCAGAPRCAAARGRLSRSGGQRQRPRWSVATFNAVSAPELTAR